MNDVALDDGRGLEDECPRCYKVACVDPVRDVYLSLRNSEKGNELKARREWEEGKVFSYGTLSHSLILTSSHNV